MNALENVTRSVTGMVDKAIICVKKPGATAGTASSAKEAAKSKTTSETVSGKAKSLATVKDGAFSFLKSKKEDMEKNGYYVFKVKYNPSKIKLETRAGTNMIQGVGGEATKMLVQNMKAPELRMSFELIFDEVTVSDAFMFGKISEASASSVASGVASVVKNVVGEGYTVKHQVEAFIGMVTQSETRQVVFMWNKMVFSGEVESIEAAYTMFNPIGNPIRATLNVTLIYTGQGSKQENEYWNTAIDKIDRKGMEVFEKAGNLFNFR